jgi:hypothetical protein
MLEHPVITEAAAFMDMMAESVDLGDPGPGMPERLFKLLGGPYMRGEVGGSTLDLNVEPCDTNTLAARQFVLLKIFIVIEHHGKHYDRLSALAALNRSECWTPMLESLPLTYELAKALVDFVDRYWPTSEMYQAVEPEVLEILNAWLKPRITWSELPGPRTVCAHVFGDAWCALVLPDEYTDKVGGGAVRGRGKTHLHEFINAQKPQFLEGLCRGQDALMAGLAGDKLSLPEFDPL